MYVYSVFLAHSTGRGEQAYRMERVHDTPHVCGLHVYYIIIYYTCRCTMPQPPGVSSSYLGTGSLEQIIIACIQRILVYPLYSI